jgi:hypothetical protein
MNILTDILSLIRQGKFSKVAEKDDVLVLGKWNETPDMTGVASPIPYKAVKLIKISDFKIEGKGCTNENTPLVAKGDTATVYKKTVNDPDTGECTVYFRTLKSLSSNLTLNLSSDDDYVEITTEGEPNTAENIGRGFGLYKDKVGESLRFKSIVAGSNINISDDGSSLVINATGGGDQTSAINIGGGNEVFESEIGDQLRFRTIIGAGDIDVQTKGDTISISNFTEVPKTFRALLSQAGDADPIITVLENTTDFTLSVSRDQPGTYQFDFSPAVADVNKIAITVSQTGKSGPQLFNINSISDEDFSLQTFFGSTSTLQDSQLLYTPLEILVYL